jgi:hypothetical protein
MTQGDSPLADLYTGYWSPFHGNLCCFKVSVLAPLEWGHQMLSCFGFSTYSYISCMCSPLVMWSKSNHIAVFALDLKSTYEGEHTIFGLLSLADLIQNDVLQFHPFTCRWYDFILLHDWVKFHCVQVPHFLDPFIMVVSITWLLWIMLQ